VTSPIGTDHCDITADRHSYKVADSVRAPRRLGLCDSNHF